MPSTPVDGNGYPIKKVWVDLTNQTAAASADVVVAAVAGKRIRVRSLSLSVGVAAVVSLQSNSVRISEQWWTAAFGGRERPSKRDGWYETEVGEALKCLCNGGGGAAVIGGLFVEYVEV